MLHAGEQASSIALGHDMFRKLRDAKVPTFAFVNGAAMGGGLELALHATTGRCPPACRRSRSPRCSSAWSRAGAAPSCCPT